MDRDALESLESDRELMDVESPPEKKGGTGKSEVRQEAHSTRFSRTSETFTGFLNPVKRVFESAANIPTNVRASSIRHVLRRMVCFFHLLSNKELTSI